MIKLLLLCGVLALLSCAKPNPGEGTVKEVNPESLKQAGQTLCAVGETLAVRPVTPSEKVSDFATEVKAVGFLKGTKACALTSDYHQDSILDSWFRIVLQDDCLQNGSLWTIQSFDHPDHSTVLELIQLGRDPEHHLRIQAGYSVSLQSLYSASGMTLYKCSAP